MRVRHLWLSIALLAGTARAEDVAAPEAVDGEPADALDDRWVPGEVADLDALSDWQRSVAHVDLSETRGALVADGFSYRHEELEVTFDSGYLFPLYSGHTDAEWEAREAEAARGPTDEDDALPTVRGPRRAVGYVFVGTGHLELAFTERPYAREFANHMVMDAGHDRASVAAIAEDGAPFESDVTAGVVLSGDPALHDRLDALPFVGLDAPDPTDLGHVDDAVSISPERRAFLDAHKTAARLWTRRDARRPVSWASTDRMLIEQLDEDPALARHFGEFLTTTPLGFVARSPGGDAEHDRWLSQVVDPRGWYRAKVVSEVYSSGVLPSGAFRGRDITITRQPPMDPDDPLSPPVPPVRMHGVLLDTTVTSDPTPDGFHLDTTILHDMTITARGGDQQVFKVTVPGRTALPDTWRLEALSLDDGTRITFLDPDSEAFEARRGSILVALPRPLREGQSVVLHLRTRQMLPYGNVVMADIEGVQGSLGLSTGLQLRRPSLSPSLGSEWVTTTRVGVPVWSDVKVAISGLTIRRYEEAGRRWEEAMTDGPSLYAGFALGDWIERAEPPLHDLPALRVHLFEREKDTIAGFPGEMKRILRVYQKFLPRFPWQELELFQAPDAVGGYVWIAPHGMVNLQSTRTFSGNAVGNPFREGTPHLEAGLLAHEIAHQYWGHTVRASHMSEGWVNETLSETYACLYAGLVYGQEAFDARMARYRGLWQDGIPDDQARAPLLRAYESRLQPYIVYNYGPYVMHRMLRRRIGDAAFFGALDVFAREHYRQWASSEQLLRTLQEATPEDLTDFFDFWIHTARLPAIEVTWSQTGDVVTGTVTSDVPFGTYEVPIGIRGRGDRLQTTMVQVVDGEGGFAMAWPERRRIREIVIDPVGWILARDKKVRRAR